MKKYLILYTLFILEHYLNWSDDCLKPLPKLLLKPFYYLYVIYVLFYSVFCFPLVIIHYKLYYNDKLRNFINEFNAFMSEELRKKF